MPTTRGAGAGLAPATFRRVARLAVWALGLTILSGAAVRLTGSGLGCPDWPACTRSSVVAPLQLHAWVEFANRLVNAFVAVASVGALAAALARRPRRRDLTLLSAALLIGLVGEIVLGALVVYSKLAPGLVSTHFLFGLVFLAVAAVLDRRAAIPDGPSSQGRPLVSGSVLRLSWLVAAGVAVVAALGTIVTSTGPHGGDPKAPRFGFALHAVAQVHGTAVECLIAATLAMLWLLARQGAPPAVLRRSQVLVGTMAAQAGVGYAQYLSGDPVAVVAVHVAGAAAVVVATVWFCCGLWAYEADDLVPAGDLVRHPAAEVAAG